MISKSELKQLIKEMLLEQLPGAPLRGFESTPSDAYWGRQALLSKDEEQELDAYVGQGEAEYSKPEWSAKDVQKTSPALRGDPSQRGGSEAGQERSQEVLRGLSGAESMTQAEYNLLHGPGAAQEKQIADIESGGEEDQDREEEKKDVDEKKDEKKQPKKKKKKKREEAEAENEAVDAAKNELAKMAAEQQWTAEQAAVKAKALASAQTLFGAMRGWGTDEAAINMALTSASGEEGLPEVYDAYDEILQQAIRMGIADANDGDLTQWLKDDGMDEWATQVAQANITRRRSLAGSAAEAARTAAGEAASVGGAAKTAAALQERTTYSSYPDQHKLFENWNKFVKSTKE
jgi:hypothetical protein